MMATVSSLIYPLLLLLTPQQTRKINEKKMADDRAAQALHAAVQFLTVPGEMTPEQLEFATSVLQCGRVVKGERCTAPVVFCGYCWRFRDECAQHAMVAPVGPFYYCPEHVRKATCPHCVKTHILGVDHAQCIKCDTKFDAFACGTPSCNPNCSEVEGLCKDCYVEYAQSHTCEGCRRVVSDHYQCDSCEKHFCRKCDKDSTTILVSCHRDRKEGDPGYGVRYLNLNKGDKEQPPVAERYHLCGDCCVETKLGAFWEQQSDRLALDLVSYYSALLKEGSTQ